MPDSIKVLQPDDISSIRIPWDAQYSKDDIAELISSEPSLSVWNPRTGGFLLGVSWRHRHGIGNVIDVHGPSVAVELLNGFVARCQLLGFDLALVAEYAERRRESFYAAALLDPIEEIVVYELDRLSHRRPAADTRRDGSTEQVDVSNPVAMQELLQIDHRAFPWLWWNSHGEFENYASAPGVSIEIARDASGATIGYVGMTSLGTWGHLDRIAVDPSLQGQGYGRELLEYAIARLQEQGARRVALSTQASNTVSRALYESRGFRRSSAHDYRIYGRYLRQSCEH